MMMMHKINPWITVCSSVNTKWFELSHERRIIFLNFFFYTSELQWSLDTPQVQKDIMNSVLNLCQVCFIAPVRQQIAFYRITQWRFDALPVYIICFCIIYCWYGIFFKKLWKKDRIKGKITVVLHFLIIIIIFWLDPPNSTILRGKDSNIYIYF